MSTPMISMVPCTGCPRPHSVPAGASAENHAFRLRLEQLAAVGDWQSCEPSLAMIHQRDDWRGQWLSRRGAREKWTHWACVARLTLEHHLAAGDTDGAERAARLIAVYAEAAERAPASWWWIVEGDHEVWHEPDPDEHSYVAGPFAGEDEAWERVGDADERFSVVPRLSGWLP